MSSTKQLLIVLQSPPSDEKSPRLVRRTTEEISRLSAATKERLSRSAEKIREILPHDMPMRELELFCALQITVPSDTDVAELEGRIKSACSDVLHVRCDVPTTSID